MAQAPRGIHSLVAVLLLCSCSPAAAAHRPECVPAWAQNASEPKKAECPYGRMLPGDVTWNPKQFQEEPVLVLLAVMWGYMPWVAVFGVVLELLVTRGTRQLSFCLFLGVLGLVNEKGLKAVALQKRPLGSCVVTCGMPSSHATLSMGLWALIVLDAAFRISPLDRLVLQAAHQGQTRLCPGGGRLRCLNCFFLSQGGVLSNLQFALVVTVYTLILMPVPISRVLLLDHSPEQVFAGSCWGMMLAVLWYVATLLLARSYSRNVGWEVKRGQFVLFSHDFRVPAYWRYTDYIRGAGSEATALLESLERMETAIGRFGSPPSARFRESNTIEMGMFNPDGIVADGTATFLQGSSPANSAPTKG